MKQVILVILCHLVLLVTTMGQTGESNEPSYKAYLGDQDVKAVKDLWKKVVADRQVEYEKDKMDQNLLYSLVLSQFGLLTTTMRDQDEDLFDHYADETENNLESLIAGNKKWGEPRALLSALYGLRMGYSPWKGMYLGSKSQSMMDQALKQSPNSPLVWKLYANSKFFTPEMWGGDLKEAIKAYEKSIQLYEVDTEKTKFNWFYIDTMAFLGQAYVNDGQTAKGILVYEKALKAEPEFSWVKSILLPKAKKSSPSY